MSNSVTERKRDRFRRLFKGENTPASTGSASGGLTLPQPKTLAPVQSQTQTHDPFLSEALKSLTESEQNVIRQHATDHISTTIQAAYDAAEEQKRVCEQKRWPGSERADKVLRWLDRFKSAGDIISNADPVHVGLPWAGIRILLEAAVADTRQMSALVTGLDLALYMANRLQAYCTYYQNLLPTLTTDNFRKALINLYAHILGFLARAIQVYLMSTVARKAQALWKETEIVIFEKECDKLGERADIEANNCDRRLRVENELSAKRWKQELDTTLQHIQSSVQASLDDLQVKADLSKLLIASEATYNSSTEENKSVCLNGTRSEILDHVQQWADASDSKFIFWLCGKAGTGKSTIARTVAQRFDKPSSVGKRRRLAASFFFKQGEQGRSNAHLFFSTIAVQFADLIPQMKVSLSKALNDDSLLGGRGRGVQEQFEKLLLGPLLSLDTSVLPRQNMLIVIDALDECDQDMDIRRILRLLARVGTDSSLRLRVLLTSRPELPVRLGFRELDANGNQHLHQDIILEVVQEQTIGRDIRAYFEAEFAKIRQERDDDPRLKDWPTEADLNVLVDRAIPLFIFASTVCRFVSEWKPYTRLKAILSDRNTIVSSQLAQTYLPLLNHLLLHEHQVVQNEMIRDFRRIIGPIILAADPLSVSSLAKLLGIESRFIGEEINDLLQHLHSVLDIPSDIDRPIRLLHLSFRDFLIDRDRDDKEGFWIDEVETHRDLARCCIRLLGEDQSLHSDICHVIKPGFKRLDLDMPHIALHISPDVAYACSYWPLHFVKSGEYLLDDSPVHRFLQQHFLHWLEALSWLGRLSSVVYHITSLSSATKDTKSTRVSEFLQDAKRFVLKHRYIIDLAPLQTYHSAMIFTPVRSIVRQTFYQEVPHLWAHLPNIPEKWGAEILKLEGHYGRIHSIAFSPDGKSLASASLDQTVRLWDATTGEEIHRLEGHRKEVNVVTYSPDGELVASASTDQTIRLWNVTTGEEVQKLEVHHENVKAVTFSPDGQMVASLVDAAVQLWNLVTGKQTHNLQCSGEAAGAIAFSPNGHTIASVSYDETIRTWNVETGEEIHTRNGHSASVYQIGFSHDGQTIASILNNGLLRLWNAGTGEKIRVLDESDGVFLKNVFSHDGRTIASILDDGIVRTWNIETGKQTQELISHEEAMHAIALSPDGQTIASVLEGAIIRLRDVAKGGTMLDEQPRTPRRQRDWANALAFSPSGQTIASVTYQGTIRLYDAATGEEKRVLNGRRGSLAIALSPDECTIAMALTPPAEMRVWDVATGETLQVVPDVYAHEVAFSADGEFLETDEGNFRLSRPVPTSVSITSPPSPSLSLKGQWICKDYEDLLWLPHEFRGKHAAAYGQSIAIAQYSGIVQRFRLA